MDANATGAFLGLAVCVMVLAIVLRPLLEGPSGRGRDRRRVSRGSDLARQLDERARLLEQRNAIYAAIRGLDVEHETNRLADGDYARQRAALIEEGIVIIKQLDRLEAAAPHALQADPLEEAIAALRRDDDGMAGTVLDAELEAEISRLRESPAPKG